MLEIVRRAQPRERPRLDLELHPVLQRIYAARGVRDAAELTLSLQQLLPVGTLGGTQAAAELLVRHREAGAHIIIVGDFDADGATSTALLVAPSASKSPTMMTRAPSWRWRTSSSAAACVPPRVPTGNSC